MLPGESQATEIEYFVNVAAACLPLRLPLAVLHKYSHIHSSRL